MDLQRFFGALSLSDRRVVQRDRHGGSLRHRFWLLPVHAPVLRPVVRVGRMRWHLWLVCGRHGLHTIGAVRRALLRRW